MYPDDTDERDTETEPTLVVKRYMGTLKIKGRGHLIFSPVKQIPPGRAAPVSLTTTGDISTEEIRGWEDDNLLPRISTTAKEVLTEKALEPSVQMSPRGFESSRAVAIVDGRESLVGPPDATDLHDRGR